MDQGVTRRPDSQSVETTSPAAAFLARLEQAVPRLAPDDDLVDGHLRILLAPTHEPLPQNAILVLPHQFAGEGQSAFTGEKSRYVTVVPRMQGGQGDLPVGSFLEGPGECFFVQPTAVHPDDNGPGVTRPRTTTTGQAASEDRRDADAPAISPAGAPIARSEP